MSADYYSATASQDHVKLLIKDASVSVSLSWDPVERLDYVYGCLGWLLEKNGFKGTFFKKVTREGSFAKLHYLLYRLSWIGIPVLFVLIVINPNSLPYSAICGFSWLGCLVCVYVWLTRAIFIYFKNRKLANAVFELLTTETSGDLGAFSNRLYSVELTKTEVGIKLEALRVALQTDSTDSEVIAGRIKAGILDQQSLEMHLMLYSSKWLSGNYYRILYVYFWYSFIFIIFPIISALCQPRTKANS